MKTKVLMFSCLFAAGILNAQTLEFSTYLGGNFNDVGYSLSVDGSGNCYITGYTNSSDFPTTAGTFDTSFNGGNLDAFVTKLSSSGSSIEFSTYLGGSSDDYCYSPSVDENGNCYVTGETYSTNFPVTVGVYDTSFNSGGDAFVTKLNSGGSSLVFSTFIGGSGQDFGYSNSVSGTGNCFFAGGTYSNDFPTTTGAFDTSYNGVDVFVTKLNSTGSSLDFSTFIGGNYSDYCNFISVDENGNSYITGFTASNNFPTTVGAYDTSYNNGIYDAFVTKFNSSGSSLGYSTFIGGNNYNYSNCLSVNESGICNIVGYTDSSNFPTTAGAYNISHNGIWDVFVTEFNSVGSSLNFSTFLGGSDDERGYSISVDGSGNFYVTGITRSNDFPATVGSFDTSYNGSYDVIVTKINSGGSSLGFSTYFGGTDWDYSLSLSADGSGNCYLAGYTVSSDFPTTSSAFDTSFNGNADVFVSKFDFFTSVTEQNNLAKDFQLNPNFPNPFNPSTTISYTLAKANEVRLEVYNTKGELVRTLVSEKQSTGSHSSNWDGKDERGNSVSSGVYFCKLTAGSFSQTNKMILLK